MIRVTILDTETGEMAKDPWGDFSAFWWAEGNGSCDCNRQLAFGDDGDGVCRHERHLIVDVEGDTEGRAIDEFNKWYVVGRLA